MAHCNLCNKNTRCSCKGGGCPSCGSTNKQISVMNDLLRFGLSKDTLKANLDEVKKYVDKIDCYTLYEYMAGVITEEEFNNALEEFKPGKKKPYQAKRSEVDFKATPNLERYCIFDSPSPWARCKKCNSIRKYIQGKECPMYVEKLGTTDAENK